MSDKGNFWNTINGGGKQKPNKIIGHALEDSVEQEDGNHLVRIQLRQQAREEFNQNEHTQKAMENLIDTVTQPEKFVAPELNMETLLKAKEEFRVEHPNLLIGNPRPCGYRAFQSAILSQIAENLAIPKQNLTVAPMKTEAYGDPVPAAILKLQRFAEATIQSALAAANFGLHYRWLVAKAKSEYIETHGKLPCGKSQRSRMVKKRNKKVMDWFNRKYK